MYKCSLCEFSVNDANRVIMHFDFHLSENIVIKYTICNDFKLYSKKLLKRHEVNGHKTVARQLPLAGMFAKHATYLKIKTTYFFI
jgi:hypothetical protein